MSSEVINLKKTLFILLLLLIVIYIIGLIGHPHILLVFLHISSLILFFIFFLWVVHLILKFIPTGEKKFYDFRKMRIQIIPLTIIFFYGGWAINHYFLPYKFQPISLIGNFGLLFLLILSVWTLIIRNKKRILIAGISVCILFFLLITIFNSNTTKDIETSSTQVVKSLPYLRWIPAEKTIHKTGVIEFDQEQSCKGLNLYASRNQPIAYIIDRSGNILHKWSAKINKEETWHHVEMCKNGDLIVIVKDRYLVRLDWNSKIKWVKKIRVHHDVAVSENKDIYALARKDKVIYIHGLPLPILADYVVVLSSDGKIKNKIPLYNIIKREISLDMFTNIYLKTLNPSQLLKGIVKRRAQYFFGNDTPYDMFHDNAIEILSRDIDGLCKKGDLLISVREKDLIGIISIKKKCIIWQWGPGNLIKQHHPTMLKNGNILIFDNGRERKFSRIIEVEPLTKKIIWEYKSNPPKEFFSSYMGWVQRLPNGNTLITESNKGRVFEIKKDGEKVWEFYNPVINKINNTRAAIYSMTRITELESYYKLKELAQ